jgi:methylthioribulose-1-phosphate dehydratase
VIERTGGGQSACTQKRRRGWRDGARFRACSGSGKLVKTHRYGLPQIHRRLARVSGNLDQDVTIRKIVAGEAMLLRPEDKGRAAAALQRLTGKRGKRRQRNDRLRRPAMFQGPRSGDKNAFGNRLCQCRKFSCVLKQARRSDRRFRLAPMRRIGRDHGKAREAEVGHGPRRRADVERVARADQDDVESVAQFRNGCVGEQGIIVEKVDQPVRRRIVTLVSPMAGDPRFVQPEAASEADALCATARWCYARGWAPATSGNFSVRIAGAVSDHVLITPSGLDKGTVLPEDLLEVDFEGRTVAGHGKPSAETSLHLVLYRARLEAAAILHVHSVWNTLLSGHFAAQGYFALEEYEILKGLSGVTTHEHVEQVPILANTQDYAELCRRLIEALRDYPRAHAFLLSRHGLYTWGESVAEARRHIEALEFLFEVEGRRLSAGQALEFAPSRPLSS